MSLTKYKTSGSTCNTDGLSELVDQSKVFSISPTKHFDINIQSLVVLTNTHDFPSEEGAFLVIFHHMMQYADREQRCPPPPESQKRRWGK